LSGNRITIRGKPRVAGDFNELQLSVTDSAGVIVTRAYDLVIVK
jgi:hypothetical protein